MVRTLMLCLMLVGCGGSQEQVPEPVKTPAKVEPLVIMFGDSIVARWGVIPDGIANAGVGGNTTLQLLARFQSDVLDENPKVLILEGGVNDLDREWPPADVANNMAAMIIKAQAAGIRVVLVACLPTKYPHIKSAEYNVELKLVAQTYGVTFVDTYSPFMDGDTFRIDLTVDGVHPNQAGYQVLWETLKPYL
jgi:lysophospholipase L1-like esterase